MSRRKQSAKRSNRKRTKANKRKKQANRKRQATRQPNKRQLAGMFKWLLPDASIFAKLKLHGNTKWVPMGLVSLAIMWAFSEQKHVTDAYADALVCYQSMFAYRVPNSYQGFMKALATWTPAMMKLLWPVLHQRMREIDGRFYRVDGWLPIAFDGSRSTAPRSESNEATFCAKNYGKGKTAKYRKKKSKGMRRRRNERNKPQPQEPQAWITLMWHMGLRLPWMWRLGPSNSSERAHVMEMIASGKLSKKTLFCGDAGFVGFPLWSAIADAHGFFLVRVGGNVSLLRESADYRQIKGGLVLCWPKGMQSTQEPLRLRLVKVRVGKTKMYLLTNVLDSKQLTLQQMAKFYKMRWGIEVDQPDCLSSAGLYQLAA